MLEYNTTFSPLKRLKGGRAIREQTIGIAIISKRDFDNATYDLSCTSMHCKGFLET